MRKTEDGSSITYTALPKISDLTRELKNIFGNIFKCFSHDISFGNSEISILTDTQDLAELFHNNNLLPNWHDENGRVIASGIYTCSMLEKITTNYQSSVNELKIKLGFTESVHLLSKHNGKHHFYTFCFDAEQHQVHELLINKLKAIEHFINYYKSQAADIIKDACKKEARLHFPELKINQLRKHTTNHPIFKNKINNEFINLSPRQTECLNLAFQGMTAKEIAQKINLSYRTVEHYLVNTRKKYGYASLAKMLVNIKLIS